MRFLSVIGLLALICTTWADEKLKGIACRSVHLGYAAPEGQAFYTEASIKQSAPGTYFMTCGWSKGYFGIQELGNGKKLVIFSVWDPTNGDDPKKVPEERRVKLLHKDDKVRVGRFGNEGTGGQSFFDYDWKLNETYRFLVTAEREETNRTAYSGFFYVPEDKSWKHLVTFSTESKELLRGYYSFVEDFKRDRVSTTKTRTAEFFNGWVKPTQVEWQALTKARFTGDSNPVLNIDAGSLEQRFFLSTGGTIENKTTKLREQITLPDAKRAVPKDLPSPKK